MAVMLILLSRILYAGLLKLATLMKFLKLITVSNHDNIETTPFFNKQSKI